MITDPLFYRLFETSPDTFFMLLWLPADSAREMAARYEYQALEIKETSHRVDGVFLPKEAGLRLYFLEVQFYPLPSVYAGLLAKVYNYLKQHNPSQPYCGVVLFGSRAFEPGDSAPYQPLLDAELIRRYYLDEMPEVANAPLGLSILYLIRQTQDQAPARARDLVARVKSEIKDEALRADLLELIETVIMYKLIRLSRKEIKAMLQLHDIHESRAYQEAMEEGAEKERQRSLQEKLLSISKLVAKKIPAAEIADILAMDVDLVRQEIAKNRP